MITLLAPMISSRLRDRSPIFVVAPRRCLPPVECCLGTNPSQAAKSRAFRKVSGGGASVAIAVAISGPMPGTVIALSAADGDIVYLSFASPAAKQRAPAILESQAWRALSANRDNRVFVVNNEVWQTGQGIVAARGILDDLRWLNAPIN